MRFRQFHLGLGTHPTRVRAPIRRLDIDIQSRDVVWAGSVHAITSCPYVLIRGELIHDIYQKDIQQLNERTL